MHTGDWLPTGSIEDYTLDAPLLRGKGAVRSKTKAATSSTTAKIPFI